MGTCSYVLTGTEQGMFETFGSTCHGAVSNHFFCPPPVYHPLLVGPGSVSSEIKTQVGLQRRVGQARPNGHLDKGGLAETGHGGSSRVVQKCHRRREHLSRCWHKQEVHQAETHCGHQRLIVLLQICFVMNLNLFFFLRVINV